MLGVAGVWKTPHSYILSAWKPYPFIYIRSTKTIVYTHSYIIQLLVGDSYIKGRSPSNGKLSDFSFYIDSQKSVHRKFKK
jgi:hypothetical protein